MIDQKKFLELYQKSSCFIIDTIYEYNRQIKTSVPQFLDMLKQFKTLNPRYKQLIWRNYVSGKSKNKIAREQNCSHQAITKYIFKALKQLDKKLNNTQNK